MCGPFVNGLRDFEGRLKLRLRFEEKVGEEEEKGDEEKDAIAVYCVSKGAPHSVVVGVALRVATFWKRPGTEYCWQIEIEWLLGGCILHLSPSRNSTAGRKAK